MLTYTSAGHEDSNYHMLPNKQYWQSIWSPPQIQLKVSFHNPYEILHSVYISIASFL